MPVLNITAEMLASTPDVAAASIGAVMLWPDDEKARSDAQHAKLVEMIRDEARRAPGEVTIPTSAMAWMLSAPALSAGDVETRYRNGAAAAFILLEIVIGSGVDVPIGLTAAKAAIESRLGLSRKPGSALKRVGTNTERIWSNYKPVSHLWAAHAFYRNSSVVPCPPAALSRFLAIAEWLRSEGERIEPKGSPTGAIFQPGTAWSVPGGIALPHGWMTFVRRDP